MTVIKTVIVNVAKRAWHDLEPKLIAFLATGLTATAVIAGADYVGIHLDPSLASLIVLILGGVAGYVKSSTSKSEMPPSPTISIYNTATPPAAGE